MLNVNAQLFGGLSLTPCVTFICNSEEWRETVKSTYITAGVQWNPINYIHPNINVIVTLEKINCLLKWRKIFRCSPKMAVISYPWTVALSSSVVSSLPLSSLACLAVSFIGDSVSENGLETTGKRGFSACRLRFCDFAAYLRAHQPIPLATQAISLQPDLPLPLPI